MGKENPEDVGEDIQVLYHASPIQGLSQLLPQSGSHGYVWVYATPDPVIASLFLGRLGGDLTCNVGTLGGHPYLRERFRGAFDLRYGTGSASLYVLSAEGFESGKTSWRSDWVCEQPVIPMQEMQIDNVRNHLLELVREGRLSLHRYPDEPDANATEESDLIQIFVRLYEKGGEKVRDHVERYYPQLLAQVITSRQ